MNLSKLYCKTHISCLNYFKENLFIGNGDTLEIISTLDFKVLIKLKIFNGFNIYGAKVFEKDCKTLILIYGNRFFSLYEFKQENNFLNLELIIANYNLNDWILECDHYLDCFYFILSSNKLAIFDFNNQNLELISCHEACTLYAAKFIKLDFQNISIAVGTCFSNIMICKYANKNCEVLQTLCGHNGAIFSIDFNLNLNKLATASDDRTIRIWNFDIKDKKFILEKILYGHESRIWQVCLTSKCIISVGENSSLYFWSYENGNILFKEKRKNTSYWNLIVDDTEKNIYYCGSDGSVKIKSILDTIKISSKQEVYIQHPKCLKFIFENNKLISLVVSNSLGECIWLKSTKQNCISEPVKNFGDEFSDYNVLNCKHKLFAFANKKGKFIIFENQNNEFNIIEKINAHNGKIFNILFMDNDILTCGPKGEIKIWSNFKNIQTFYLPDSKQQWITCIVKLNENLFALGERCGNVIVLDKDCNKLKLYKKIHGSDGVTDLQKHPIYQFFYSCGRDGRIIEYLFDKQNVELLRILKTGIEMDWIGRLIFDEQNGSIDFIIGFISTSFIVWSEKNQTILWSVNCGGGHRAWDFAIESKRLHFVYVKNNKLIYCIKNLTFAINGIIKPKFHSSTVLDGTELFKDKNLSKHYFATCGEDNNVFLNSLNKFNNEVMTEARLFGHISTVRTCYTISLKTKNNLIANSLLVTAGGRSQMMIWQVYLNQNEHLIVKQLANYFIFNSDHLRRKPWKEESNYFLDPQIRFMGIFIEKLNENQFLIYSLCSDATLKLFYFMFNEQFIELKHSIQLGDYCPLNILNYKKFFVLTFTNGCIKIYKKRKQSLTSSIKLDEVIESKSPLSITLNQANNVLLDCNFFSEIFSSRIHQSGINAIDFIETEQNQFLLCTAGDDTDLNVLLFNFDQQTSKIDLLNKTTMKTSHFSMISCVQFLNQELIVTCSWDRRLKIWRLKLIEEDSNIELILNCIQSVIISIPDISKLIVQTHLKKNYLILVGEGQEVYRLDLENKIN